MDLGDFTISKFSPWLSWSYVFIFFLGILVLDYLRIALRPGLRTLPGPFFARFSKLYRVFKVVPGDPPQFYVKLHEQYGPIVRTGPNTVSISDPSTIPIIYGTNYKYLKVRITCYK